MVMKERKNFREIIEPTKNPEFEMREIKSSRHELKDVPRKREQEFLQ